MCTTILREIFCFVGCLRRETKETSCCEVELTPSMAEAMRTDWKSIVDSTTEIIVGQFQKLDGHKDFGVRLTSTIVAVERIPHFYIRAIVPEGSVGISGKLRLGDEVLEINGQRIRGSNHRRVVCILRNLPRCITIVCARIRERRDSVRRYEYCETPLMNKVLSTYTSDAIEGMSGWSSIPDLVEITKGDLGLGFSILDCRDPFEPGKTIIIVKSLIPGGAAHMNGHIAPGDRLVSVNDVGLQDMPLERVAKVLTSTDASVTLGVVKPVKKSLSERESV